MKYLFVTIFTLLILSGLNSCCTKKYCEVDDQFYEIEFYNFSPGDLDSVKIYCYAKNINFVLPFDSMRVYGIYYNSNNCYNGYIEDGIKTNYEYKIKIKNTGQIFTLTDFATEERACNNCFPYRPANDYYYVLKSYYVNGQKRVSSRIQISK